jgi:ComEC/Rec2-related protein
MKHSPVPLLKLAVYAVLWCGLSLLVFYNLYVSDYYALIYPLLALQLCFCLAFLFFLRKKRTQHLVNETVLCHLSGFNSFLLPCLIFQHHCMNAGAFQNNDIYICFKVKHAATETYGKYKCEAELLAVKDLNKKEWKPLKGSILLEGDSTPLAEIGSAQIWQAHVRVKAIADLPSNYRFVLWQKGIAYRARMISGKLVQRDMTLFDPENWQHKLLVKLNNQLSFFDEQIRAVAAAMLLGYRSDISSELNKAYASTGALHVLSVSGMHLGILFYLISKLTSLAGAGLSDSVFSRLIILFLSWLYAAITGFSASVVRAAMMFSMYLMSLILDRKTDGKNLLSGSLILLLSADPVLLCSIGFQLSYLALAGILWFQPLMDIPSIKKESLIGKFWSLSAAGIAAQLTTTPLSLMYFGQFPVYFLLSNLLVAPLGFIIMASGTVLLPLPARNILSELSARILGNSVLLLNKGLLYLERLPGSVLKPVYLNVPAAAVAGIAVWMCYLLLKKFRSKALLYLLGFVLLLQAILFGCSAAAQRKATFIVYALPPHAFCAFINRGTAYTVGRIPFEEKRSRPAEVLLRSWAEMRVRRQLPATEPAGIRNTLFSFHGKTVLMLRDAGEPLPAQPADYWVISGSYLPEKAVVSTQSCAPEKIIFDSSVRSRQKAILMQSLAVKDFEKKLWDVSVKGAFIVDL